MGPRLVSRGKVTSTIFGGAMIWLQWGRDLLVAESPLTLLRSSDWHSFNGAATC